MRGPPTWLSPSRFRTSTFFPATRFLTTKSGGEHCTLQGFLDYAARISLDHNSTIFHGTCYEYVVGDSLARFGLNLQRSGGKLDKGIDLLGPWLLPTLSEGQSLNVIVQCKALSKKLGPNHVREMEGAFAGAPASWRVTEDAEKQSNVIGLLVAPKEATKGVRDAIARSRLPMAFAMVERTGRIAQIFWNKAAALRGLDAVTVQVRRKLCSSVMDAKTYDQNDLDQAREELVLLSDGRVFSDTSV